jgi:hypothetical protein
MLMRSLEAHDVPEAVLDAWESHCGRELLPVQELAVKAGVLAGRSLLVSSPTSSGKTFVGEMAAIQAALSGRRVVYLVPTRALAEAKYRQFCARYEPVGLSVAIATRDRRHQHDRVARGDFDLVVAVPEKLRALLAARPGLAEVIGTVVADELQVLADPERGPCLELLLGDLVAAAPELQVVGLSAVLGEAQQVAQWLGAELLRDDRRPVELRRGVLEGGSYHYRQHNDGAEGTEKWPELAEGPADPGERMAQVAAALAERDGSALIFVRDRRTTELMARAIAQMGQLPAAEGTVAALEALALHNLHVPGLGRGQILALLEAGLDCQAAVAHASPALLESLLGPAMAARTLAVACGVRTGPAEPARRVAPAIPPRDADGEEASTRQSRLIIDAERPDRILLDAEPVELRPAEFRLLSVLAESPRRCVGYEAIYEGMWSGEAFVEPAQIYSHRSRLAKKLDDAVPGGGDLLRTIPRRGLMLDLPPEGVTLR